MSDDQLNNSTITVSEIYSDQRIDNFLIRELKGVPKDLIYRLLRKKFIKVNGKRVKPDYRVQTNDEVFLPNSLRVQAPKAPVEKMARYFHSLSDEIIAETDGYLVLNKPSGMACHGGSGISASVVDIMRTTFPDLQLAHRLDKETSGCLILPKNRKTLLQINAQIQAQALDKYYLCIVEGVWPKRLQKVTLPLTKRSFANGDRRVVVDEEEGKSATTLVKRLAVDKHSSLLAIKLITGRTHQIRVHCASSGHSIIGDSKYGQKNQAERLYLHAVQLGLEDNQQLFTAPLDESFQTMCEQSGFKVDLNAADYF